MNSSTTLTVPADVLLRAAHALSLATRYDEALELLPPAPAIDDLQVRADVVLAHAAVTGRRDYTRGRRSTGDPAELDEVASHEAIAWDAAMHRLRTTYTDQLRHEDGSPWMGPDGRDPAVGVELSAEAARLRDSAADDVRRGWAEMCLGWISDNIAGDRGSAPSHYERALVAGRECGELMLVFEAQRHLGDHAHDDGDLADARERWQESTTAAAGAGHVTGVLAQQLLLAVLARDEGDEAGAGALVLEVRRWAAAIGARQIAGQCEGFLDGADPTQPSVTAQEEHTQTS
jgi:hypothetical protein